MGFVPTTNVQEQEEFDFARGPRLWDATPGVCCAAFQLGACAHTESFDYEDEDDSEDEPYTPSGHIKVVQPMFEVVGEFVYSDDEPF